MTHRVILMRCQADACEQGRRPCPAHTACEVAEPEESDFPAQWIEALLVRLVMLVALLGVIAAVVWPA